MLKVYDSYKKDLVEFKPIKAGQVKMYYCGPTVYWTQHIGNMRGATMADLIVRTFKYLGNNVKFVRNITDVGHLVSDEDKGEDKMEKGVKREGLKPEEIAKKYADLYFKDLKKMNTIEPDVVPWATKYVQEMIDLVQILIDKGYAYSTDLAVYFDVAKFPDYEKYTNQKLEEKEAGAGTGEVEDPDKKHPADFALWFFKAGAHQNALQTWPLTFESKLVENGQGFPGWHIECSAMSMKNLGKTMDVHMGGIEHKPIHHPNEIAQSESANGVKFSNYWLHNEHLMVDGGKMSKSEGTAFSVTEVEEKGFDPLALRYLFLQAHYRSKQNFTWEAMQSAQNGYDHLKNKVNELRSTKKGSINKEFKEKFINYLEDDFNIPQALALVQEVLKSDLSQEDKLATILDFDQVFGLNLFKVEKGKKYVLKVKTAKFNITTFPADLVLTKGVKDLIIEREEARQNKDWAKSDELRDKIKDLGLLVEDTEQGQIVKK